MTRRERLNKLAVFCRDFNKLLEDIPAEDRGEIRELFCTAIGRYLKITEEVTDVKT